MGDKPEKIKGYMRWIADDAAPLSSRERAAFDLWTASNSTVGAQTILNQGYPGEILNIFDSLEFDGASGLKARLVGVLCCLAANLPLDDAERLFVYDVQSRLYDLLCSTEPIKQPINALCGLCNLLNHHGDHVMMHGNVQMYKLAIQAHDSCVKNKAFHGAYYSRWGLVRCLAYMGKLEKNVEPMKDSGIVDEVCSYALKALPSQRIEEFVMKFIAALSLWVDIKREFKTDLYECAMYQAQHATGNKGKVYSRLAIFNRNYLQMEGNKRGKEDSVSEQHILILPGMVFSPLDIIVTSLKEKHKVHIIDTYETSETEWMKYEQFIRESALVLVQASMENQLELISRSFVKYAQKLGKPVVLVQTNGYYKPRDWIADVGETVPFLRYKRYADGEVEAAKRLGQILIENNEFDLIWTVLKKAMMTNKSKISPPTQQLVTLEVVTAESSANVVQVGGAVQGVLEALVQSMKVHAGLIHNIQTERLQILRERLAIVESKLSICETEFVRRLKQGVDLDDL
eukprot:m.120210 g.120210  ORF g.120210 m.120210 type:complete len:515 (+) comp9370_c3_seq1:202-1746(+)